MSIFDIRYIIAIPDDGEYSPFQGFSMSLLDQMSRINITRHVLSHCPPSVQELYDFQNIHLQMRLAGQTCFHVAPLVVSAFGDSFAIEPDWYPFTVVFVEEEASARIEKWSSEQKVQPLVCNVSKWSKDYFLERNVIKSHVERTLDVIKQEIESVDFDCLKKVIALGKPIEKFLIQDELTGHNTNWPNDLALMSCGAEFEKTSEPLCGKDELYVEKILESSARIAHLRNLIPQSALYRSFPPMPSLIFTSASSYAHVRNSHNKPNSEPCRRLSKVIHRLARQSTYSLLVDEEIGRYIEEEDVCKKALGIRAMELTAFTDGLAVRAASYVCPVIRVPEIGSNIRESGRRLVDSLRAMNPRKKHKLPNLANRYFDELTDSIPEKFQEILRHPHVAITLISDTPYELTRVKGIPLMFRQIVSRINGTPGNQAYQNTIPRKQLNVRYNEIGEVVVVRSFRDDDPLRKDLETSISKYKLLNGEPLPVRILDVKNKREFVDAVNSAKGLMLILDCHGSHRKGDDVACLNLSAENVNVWELREEVTFPPIVFACACDTNALDRSHVTVSAGLLACGARTTIGTSMPIHSKDAAIYVGRLLFRVFEFIRMITKQGSIRWNVVFGLFQRMVFVSEILRMLEKEFKTDWKLDFQTQLTEVIHTKYFDWYEEFLEQAATEYGTTVERIEELRQKKLPFPESFKYVQYGNPESILFHPDS